MVSLNDVLLAMSNIPVDDPIAEIWGRGLQGGYKTIEYTGALPITISANGDVLIDYRIYGADGGVGERTENLFDKNTITPNSYLKSDGSVGTFGAFLISDFIPVEEGKYLAYRTHTGYTGCYNCIYDENKNFLRSINTESYQTNVLMTIGSNEKYIRISVNTDKTDIAMVVKGSTAPTTYTTYGYKLPMTVGDGNTAQTVPVYIGENQLDAIGEYVDYVDYDTQKIIRRIEKIEFDGSETWFTYQNSFYIGVPNYIKSVWETCAGLSRSSHYAPSLSAAEIGTYCLGGLVQSPSTRWNGNIVINAGMTKTEFIAYLESQAAAGTPVTFWYVVEIPVEEDPPVPLPEIPTINGETVIDYDGTPKPSQMYIKYKNKG